MNGGNLWTVILAAGEGSRLRSLTTTAGGLSVPKQFCSLYGGESLLDETVARAAAVTAHGRILAVVADAHRRWWEGPLWALPSDNVIVQPENKGTAAGLLLPLLHIVRRDPQATVLVLPSDHFFHDEAALARTLQRLTLLATDDPQHVYLLGLEPEQADPELGYIVPAAAFLNGVAPVRRFVEKPAIDAANALVDAGALLNMFVIAASARALLGLYLRRHVDLVAPLMDAVARDADCLQDASWTRRLYPHLSTLDFSRHVLEGQEAALRVLRAAACGWSDLGTPHRVLEVLNRGASRSRAAHGPGRKAFLSLAEQHSRQQANSHVLAPN